MSERLEQCVDEFNECFNQLITNIANVCPNSLIGTNYVEMKIFTGAIISNKNTKDKLMTCYFDNIYLEYKDEILRRDENFFLKKDSGEYVNVIKNAESKLDVKNKGSTNFVMEHIMDIKNSWRLLNRANKDVVFDSLIILCKLCDRYVELYKLLK